jgi:hypothetical protein
VERERLTDSLKKFMLFKLLLSYILESFQQRTFVLTVLLKGMVLARIQLNSLDEIMSKEISESISPQCLTELFFSNVIDNVALSCIQ